MRNQYLHPPCRSRPGLQSSCRSAQTGLSSSRRRVGRGRRSADRRRAGQVPPCCRPEARETADPDLPAAGHVTKETEGRTDFGDVAAQRLGKDAIDPRHVRLRARQLEFLGTRQNAVSLHRDADTATLFGPSRSGQRTPPSPAASSSISPTIRPVRRRFM